MVRTEKRLSDFFRDTGLGKLSTKELAMHRYMAAREIAAIYYPDGFPATGRAIRNPGEDGLERATAWILKYFDENSDRSQQELTMILDLVQAAANNDRGAAQTAVRTYIAWVAANDSAHQDDVWQVAESRALNGSPLLAEALVNHPVSSVVKGLDPWAAAVEEPEAAK
jgi:hypothetical protein